MSSVLWHCCLGDRKGIRPVKNSCLVRTPCCGNYCKWQGKAESIVWLWRFGVFCTMIGIGSCSTCWIIILKMWSYQSVMSVEHSDVKWIKSYFITRKILICSINLFTSILVCQWLWSYGIMALYKSIIIIIINFLFYYYYFLIPSVVKILRVKS